MRGGLGGEMMQTLAAGTVWRALGAAATRVGAPGATLAAACGASGRLPLAARVCAEGGVAATRHAFSAVSAAGRRAASSSAELVVAPKVAPPGLVKSFKEELWRRQMVATTYFTHPVAALEEVKPDAGKIELAAAVFQQALRLDILNRVVLWQRAKKRVIARPAKTRAMVSGGGKKPWRQKGSGRARHGSIRCVRVGNVRTRPALFVPATLNPKPACMRTRVWLPGAAVAIGGAGSGHQRALASDRRDRVLSPEPSTKPQAQP